MAADRRTQFRVAWRAFVEQFFTSQSAVSDHQLHQSYVWVLVFLLVPGAFLLIQLFPDFQSAVILARLGRVPVTLVDDFLAWIALFLTTYSMVAVGLLTVLCWDSLTFDRRDALVLGSLPVATTTLLAAKLAALATLLLVVSLSIAALNATMFALITSDQLGFIVFLKHLFAMFVATFGSGVFIVSAIVLLRAGLALAGGPGVAAACGPALQFFCVVLVLCLIFLSPSVWQVPFMTASRTDWTPPAWFVGVFEWLRDSPRAEDPAFPFLMYTHRAAAGTVSAVGGALVFSIGEFHRQMSGALSPGGLPGLLGRAPVSRRLARLVAGRHAGTRAMTDFTLLTLARNRRQQLPIALNAAVGAAVVIVALASKVGSLEELLLPRTAILWIPLVMAYWLMAGLRASFFVPSESAAAWTFRFHPSGGTVECWRAARASMLGFAVPRVLLICLALVPALGWRLTLWHAGLVCGVSVAVAGLMAGGVAFVPFTRAFEAGHARLRTWWVAYAAGMYVFAYWPARLSAILVQEGRSLTMLIATIWLIAGAIEVVMRRFPVKAGDMSDEAYEEEGARISVLDLAGAKVR